MCERERGGGGRGGGLNANFKHQSPSGQRKRVRLTKVPQFGIYRCKKGVFFESNKTKTSHCKCYIGDVFIVHSGFFFSSAFKAVSAVSVPIVLFFSPDTNPPILQIQPA